MEYYWLLTSHITVFFPIYICYLNYKKFKKVNLYLLYLISFLILYFQYSITHMIMKISSFLYQHIIPGLF